MRIGRLLTVLAPGLLVGAITWSVTAPDAEVVPEDAEVVFGTLAVGSSAGANATSGSASVAGSLTTITTDLLYINNTNATDLWWAQIELNTSTALTDITTATIAIDNGTASTNQILVVAELLTQSEGVYVRLEPSSTNKITLTHLVGIAFGGATFETYVRVSDDGTDAAHYVMTATIDLT